MSQKPKRLRIVLLVTALAAGWSPISTVMATQSGDMNCDGAVNMADIPLFVDALLATGGFGHCGLNRADMNCNGLIDGLDTQPFVAALLAGPGPCFGGQLYCDGVCREVGLDPSNCVCCGHQCGPGQNCLAGLCRDAEPPGP